MHYPQLVVMRSRGAVGLPRRRFFWVRRAPDSAKVTAASGVLVSGTKATPCRMEIGQRSAKCPVRLSPARIPVAGFVCMWEAGTAKWRRIVLCSVDRGPTGTTADVEPAAMQTYGSESVGEQESTRAAPCAKGIAVRMPV